MAYINFLGSIGDVDNADKCIEALKRIAGVDEIDLEMLNKYHEGSSDRKRYFTDNMRELKFKDEDSNIKLARYLWVDTGYTSKGEKVYASFYKYNIGWSGAYIGTEERLLNKISGYNYKRASAYMNDADDKDSEVKHDPAIDTDTTSFGSYFADDKLLGNEDNIKVVKALNNNKFCITLYSKLLIKENWAIPKGRGNRLISYIDTLSSKIQREIKGGTNKWYILNGDGRAAVINSGLIDKFMNDIYLLLDVELDGTFKNPMVIESKTDLLNIGFSKDDIRHMPEPVKFYKCRSELIFEGDIEDFNLDNREKLNHIINERRSRFPEELRGLSEGALCEKLKTSVENAIRMSKRDYSYIVPMYNCQQDVIQYLVPMYINNDISQGPELVIVAGLVNEFYEVMTILNPDDAYDNARILSVPDSSWLKVNIEMPEE